MKTRACQGIHIAVTDGLKRIGEALWAALPATTLQKCIVHLMRNITPYWGRAAKEWRTAMSHSTIACGERFTKAVH